MLASLDDEQGQEQRQDQATQQNQEPDPGDQEFDAFEEEDGGAKPQKVEGFYGPLVSGDENGEGGPEGQPAQPQTQDDGNPADQQKPIRFVRYQGREIPLYSKEEEDGLLQKGMDYTQKTMALAPWRKRVEFLYQNPDKLQLIDRLMAGEDITPEAIAAASKEAGKAAPAKQDTKPEQKDDETFEEYTERLAEWKARMIVKDELDQFRATNAKQQFQAAAIQDPLMPYVTQAIQADLQSGLLPEAVFKAADDDPAAATKLYGAYRTRIAALIEQQKGRGGTDQPATPPQQRPFPGVPQPTQQRAAPRPAAPFAESGRGARRSATGRDISKFEAGVIRDMKRDDFEALVDRVKNGG